MISPTVPVLRRNFVPARRIGSIFDTAMEAGILVKDDRKKYHYKGLTGTMPNDEVGDLPFSASSDEKAPF